MRSPGAAVEDHHEEVFARAGLDGGVARFGDGIGIDADVVRAAETAVAQALAPLQGRTPDLVVFFVTAATADDAAAAGERVAALVPGAAVLGCTAGGVIGGGQGVEGSSAVSAWAAVLPEARVRTFHLEVMRADAGMAVVGMPERDRDEVVVLLADPWSFPVDGFVDQANTALPGLPIVGGVATGPAGQGSTRLFVDGRVVDRGAVGILLGGVEVRTLVSQGCRPVGPAMTVTASEGGVVHALAGVPAVRKVEEVLTTLDPADQALASGGLQLGIAADEYAEEHDYLVRGILGVDPSSGGLVVGDQVEVGQTVRLQVRDADAADAELRTMLWHLRQQVPAPVGGALVFSCNGRGAHLFGSAHGGASHDVTVVREALAVDGVAGFFAGGEIGPVAGRNALHGFTASLLVFP
ncbi:MAG: FIST N-terminal domain-containing protein [Mycobacteriales bacterium]|nr:FIST N-terminal domain-containing protein [Mycobacteriales bacterium]